METKKKPETDTAFKLLLALIGIFTLFLIINTVLSFFSFTQLFLIFLTIVFIAQTYFLWKINEKIDWFAYRMDNETSN